MKRLLVLCFVVLGAGPVLGQAQIDFLQDIEAAEATLMAARSNPLEIKRLLHRYYQLLFRVDPRQYDQEKLKRNSTQIARKLQTFRIMLKNEIETWPRELVLDPRVQESVLAIQRASHYAEDMVAEVSLGNQKSKKGDRLVPAFQGGLPWTFTPDGKPLKAGSFQSGDILVMRGGSSVSAAISRIGDLSAIFSHAAMVYVDEATGRKYVVEALIEKGLTINPLEKVLNLGVGRMLALRPRDQKVGKAGAEALYRIARASIDSKKMIVYDFSMSEKLPNLSFQEMMSFFEGSSDPRVIQEMSSFKVFCSLLVDFADKLGREILGYPRATDSVRVRTTLNPKNRAFLDRLGLQPHQKDVYAPGDIELDSRFNLIGDFREPRRTAALRTDDFILDKIFDWMDRDGLQFQESSFLKGLSSSVNATSKVGPLRQMYHSLGLAVAPHVPPEVISTVIMLDHMRNQILQRITPTLRAFESRYGVPMAPYLIYQEIEKVYQADPGVLKYLAQSPHQAPSCKTVVGGG